MPLGFGTPQGNQLLPSTTGEETLAGRIGGFKAGTLPSRPGSPEEARLPIPRQILMTPQQRAGIAAPGIGSAVGEGTAYRMLVGAQGGQPIQPSSGTPPPAIMAQQVAPAGPQVTPPPPTTGSAVGSKGVVPQPTPATAAPAPAGQPSGVSSGRGVSASPAAAPSPAPAAPSAGVLQTGGNWWEGGTSSASAGAPSGPAGAASGGTATSGGTPGNLSPGGVRGMFGSKPGAVSLGQQVTDPTEIPSGLSLPGAKTIGTGQAWFESPIGETPAAASAKTDTGSFDLAGARDLLSSGMDKMARGDWSGAIHDFELADQAAGGSLGKDSGDRDNGGASETGGGGDSGGSGGDSGHDHDR